ncbi:MAG: hypothetical protein IPG89_15570 [Bacteroidetes bacterium]|nr:hypothetical protein [Bacteroidota bacterium]
MGTSVVSDIEGPTVTITDSTMISCFGANNGGAVAVANGGVLPYLSLGWSGTTQSGLVATNLGPGPAAILVYDAAGCLGSIKHLLWSLQMLLVQLFPIRCNLL